jgi:type II protein arginine methyltransferase
MRDRTRDLLTLLPLVEGRPDAMVALARQLRGAGEQGQALDLAARALALAPQDGEVRTLAREVLSDGVPNWHFVIVRDQIRNQAYEDALRRAVFPGARVLEIGTGTGLLAMMAARAGATVTTCEADPAVAAAARDVIAANGLSDRIRVVNKHSTALELADLGGERADILVSEIVSNDLLGEGALPAHADAIPRLLKAHAPVIPARGRIRVALAEDSGWVNQRMGEASGFDLTPFNRLAAPRRDMPVQSARIALRSEAADLFAFDFAAGDWPDRRTMLTLASLGGAINGVVMWMALEMDSAGSYENRPHGAASCWSSVFWPFECPIETLPDQPIRVGARHEKQHVRLWYMPH